MAKRLTEQERKDRDAARKAEAAQQARKWWHEKMVATQLQMADAGVVWDQAFADKKLTLRDLWLVLALFETEERIHMSGSRKSCKSRWFDNIAPRARTTAFSSPFGNPGYASRTANKAHQFLELSRNGYLWMTDLGYALVQHLRTRHPELAAGKVENASWELEVEGLGTIPAPRWKDWTNWDEGSV